jgi:alkylation response protein AidB-like acyl-CoA dehydrogenase
MIFRKDMGLDEFRPQVRRWLDANWPGDPTQARPTRPDALQRWWFLRLRDAGLSIPHWPSEYGGQDLSLAHRIVVAEEMARADAPALPMYVISLNHIPVTFLRWGTPEQRRKYLPGIADGDVWCQGFSEPNAGSDLVSLRTRADRTGDVYLVNGQKIWSSYSMYAKYCILLARTDRNSRRHAGISYFVLDMKAPGVEVRPIPQATGKATFAEIFLTDVEIPAADLVGEEGLGWKVAQTTLSAERGVLSVEGIERLRYRLEAAYGQASSSADGWLSDPEHVRRFLDLFARTLSVRRSLRALLADDPSVDERILPALIKIASTELVQDSAEFLVRAGGLREQVGSDAGDVRAAGAMLDYVSSFGGTIAAGSNEIMRNIIAERGMGMLR